MRTYFIISLFLLSLHGFSGSQPLMVRAWFPEGASLDVLTQWGTPLVVDHERRFVIVETDDAGRAGIERAGFHVEIDQRLTHPPIQRKNNLNGIPDFPCYLTLAETNDLIDNLVATFPSLATSVDIGDSWEKIQGTGGHDIRVLRITNSDIAGPKPVFFVLSSLHPRELAPTGVTAGFAQYLLNNYGKDGDATSIVDHVEVHILLIANPDGRAFAEQLISWRKNANNDFCTGSSLRGVDLNRNLEFRWAHTSSCSSSSQCANTFRGSSAASEPETDALQSYLRAVFPDQRGSGIGDPAPDDAQGVFIDIHSHGGQVLWPYGFDETPAPNDRALTTLGRKLAWYNGYSPEKASASFDTCGTTDDFAYGDLGMAAYTYEIGNAFFESCENFEAEIWPQNFQSLLYAAKAARAPYLWPAGPNAEDLQPSASALAAGSTLRVTAHLDDDRFQVATNPPGTEPLDLISGGEVFADVPPWLGGTGETMAAVDGSYDTASESAEADLDTTGWTEGTHTLWVQGHDDGDHSGTPSAVHVQVVDASTHLGVSGSVREAGTQNPLRARVEVGDGTAWSFRETGQLSLMVTSGSYQATASLDGYCDAFAQVEGLAGQSRMIDFELLPIQETLFTDWANPLAWTPENHWALVEEGGALIWTDSPDANYDNDAQSALYSPQVLITRGGPLVLRLEHIHRLDTYSDDQAIVEYRWDNEPWQALKAYRGDRSWLSEALTLPARRGGLFQMRFRLRTDNAFTHEGWSLKPPQLGQATNCSLVQFLQAWPSQTILEIIPDL